MKKMLIVSILSITAIMFWGLHVPTNAIGAEAPFTDPSTGMQFVSIKGGCFDMGDTFGGGEKDEKPVHRVCVDDFYLGKYEVTVGQFRKFIDATGYKTKAEKGNGCFVDKGDKWEKDPNANWRNPGFSINDSHPAVCISWNDAVAYAKWMEGKGGKSYRLPTEAEWEYAARDGGKNVKYAGGSGQRSGNIADESGKRKFPEWKASSGYDDKYVYTAPVGSFQPSALGLYDMDGNAWEWCSDWYGEKYYTNSPKDNPKGPEKGQYRVLRGGSWTRNEWYGRAGNRGSAAPTIGANDSGFRLGFSAK